MEESISSSDPSPITDSVASDRNEQDTDKPSGHEANGHRSATIGPTYPAVTPRVLYKGIVVWVELPDKTLGQVFETEWKEYLAKSRSFENIEILRKW